MARRLIAENIDLRALISTEARSTEVDIQPEGRYFLQSTDFHISYIVWPWSSASARRLNLAIQGKSLVKTLNFAFHIKHLGGCHPTILICACTVDSGPSTDTCSPFNSPFSSPSRWGLKAHCPFWTQGLRITLMDPCWPRCSGRAHSYTDKYLMPSGPHSV